MGAQVQLIAPKKSKVPFFHRWGFHLLRTEHNDSMNETSVWTISILEFLVTDEVIARKRNVNELDSLRNPGAWAT